MKKLLVGIVCILVFPIVLYLTFLFFFYDCDPDFLKIDACLDSGGRWDSANRICVTSQSQGSEEGDPLSK